MKLYDNLYQVGGPQVSHTFDCAVYLIDSGDGLYLIDCGTPEGYDMIKENIASDGFDIKDIKAIFATHGHYDHIGSGYLFREQTGCKIYLHNNDRERVETGDDIKTTAEILYGKKFTPFRIDESLIDGMEFILSNGITMEVVETPGHTPGGVCFVLNINGYVILIAGDTLHGGFSLKTGSDEDEWRNSISKLMKRHYDAYSFGHMVPKLITDADERIEELSRQFGIYYVPWFKPMKDSFKYQ